MTGVRSAGRSEAVSPMSDDLRQLLTEQRWFHSTQWTRWEDSFKTDKFVVHVGTETAAGERVAAKVQRVPGKHTRMIYELRVTGDPRVTFEMNADAGTTEHLFSDDYDAWLYPNDCEDRGSISLAIRGNFLEVVAKRFLTVDVEPLPLLQKLFKADALPKVYWMAFDAPAAMAMAMPSSLADWD